MNLTPKDNDMKRLLPLGPALLLAFAPPAVFAKETEFSKMLDELLPKLGAEKIADRHAAQRTLLDTCLQLGAKDNESNRPVCRCAQRCS